MLRVRFHGRGGHGIKTASRILGTAAFRSGMQVQDSPLYGAERRGAAVVAFTRIGEEPILERGIIANPDIIVVADESLMADPSAGVMLGAQAASVMFVNSPRSAEEVAQEFTLSCPVLTADLTSQTLEVLGRGSALSAAVAGVACALTGTVSLENLQQAVREELAELPLSAGVIEKNVILARQVYEGVSPLPIKQTPAATGREAMHTPAYVESSGGAPIIFHIANAGQRHTGSWRIFRPIIDRNLCTRCQICLLRCPDAAISLDGEGYPVIDYDNCKGCMICCRECPVRCIEEQKEVAAW